jgi:hypothetical protein
MDRREFRFVHRSLARQAGLVSKTTPFKYRGKLFWVFDVCESILFAEMAGIAAQIPARGRTPWLAGLEEQLRVDAIVGASFAVLLDDWCDGGHEEEFIALAAQAGERLALRGRITAQQAADWIVLDGTPVIWRGQDSMDTTPITTFVHAMTGIIRGTYPDPPQGLHWYFGLPGDVRAI